MQSSETKTGTVKWFNKEKGFGFIVHDLGETFFHISKVINEEILEADDSVTFKVINSYKGPQASEVKKIGGKNVLSY